MTLHYKSVQVSKKYPTDHAECVTQAYDESEACVYKLQIDFKSGWLKKVFTTLPDKGRFMCKEIRVHSDTFTSVFTAPTINVWYTAGNYYEFVSGQNLPNASFAAGQYTAISMRANSGTRLGAPQSTDIYVNVTSAATGTAYTATVFIKGHYEMTS